MKKKPVEKIVLISVLAFFALGSAALAFFFPTKKDLFKGNSDVVVSKFPEELTDETAAALPEQWQNPPEWKQPENKHRLLASLYYLYDVDGKIIPFDSSGDVLISGNIPLAWAQKYGLDVVDPNLFRNDPDNDGFYNELEFEGKTDPSDAESHPPFLTRLRMRDADIKPFEVEFRSHNVLGGEPIFYVTIPGGSRPRTEVVKIGDMIPTTKWKVVDFKKNLVEEKNPATGIVETIDKSELTLEQSEIGLKEVLICRVPNDLADVKVDFVMLLPGELAKNITVTRGLDFSMPQVPDAQYKLLGATSEAATIKDLANNQTHEIARITIEEEELVPGYEPTDDLMDDDEPSS